MGRRGVFKAESDLGGGLEEQGYISIDRSTQPIKIRYASSLFKLACDAPYSTMPLKFQITFSQMRMLEMLLPKPETNILPCTFICRLPDIPGCLVRATEIDAHVRV